VGAAEGLWGSRRKGGGRAGSAPARPRRPRPRQPLRRAAPPRRARPAPPRRSRPAPPRLWLAVRLDRGGGASRPVQGAPRRCSMRAPSGRSRVRPRGGGGHGGRRCAGCCFSAARGARRCAASWTTVPGLSHPPRRSPASGAKRPQPRGCLARWLVRPANRGGCGCGGQELWRRWGGASRSYWTAMGAGGAPPRGWAAMGTGRERGEHKGKGRKGCCFCRSAPYPWSHYPGRQNATTPAISSCEATHLPGYSPALRGGRRGSGARCTDGAEASRGGGRFWRR
jgi:hypothetical protein